MRIIMAIIYNSCHYCDEVKSGFMLSCINEKRIEANKISKIWEMVASNSQIS